MKWRLEFYNERQGVLARYDIEAPLPAEAIDLGWKAVLAEHASTLRSGRLTLFERAKRIPGQDASGWILYRIGEHDRRGASSVAQPYTA